MTQYVDAIPIYVVNLATVDITEMRTMDKPVGVNLSRMY